LVIVLLLGLSFGAGFGLSRALSDGTSREIPREFDALGEVWHQLSQDYVNKDALDPEKLTQGAIKGLIEALGDPYTYYLDAETYELALSSLEGSLEGIGAIVGMEDGWPTVISPIVNAPAEEQGIRAGDRILEIDGEGTSEMPLIEAVLKIRGEQGTIVTLLVLHQDETEPIEIEITREEIKLDSVYLELLPGNIARIMITHFTLRTGEEMDTILAEALSDGVAGIVLDLRGNPGGLLNSAVDVADQFLDDVIILYEANGEGKVIMEFKASAGGLATDLPLIVLVDGGSASASEVLAGAIQDHERAPLIGTTTFGKGSVQAIRELSGGSALYVTAASWLTPAGHQIDGQGLIPDFEVQRTEEDIAQGIDPQLERAIDYIETGE
jgi:carboxyl-terminal processing protease